MWWTNVRRFSTSAFLQSWESNLSAEVKTATVIMTTGVAISGLSQYMIVCSEERISKLFKDSEDRTGKHFDETRKLFNDSEDRTGKLIKDSEKKPESSFKINKINKQYKDKMEIYFKEFCIAKKIF